MTETKYALLALTLAGVWGCAEDGDETTAATMTSASGETDGGTDSDADTAAESDDETSATSGTFIQEPDAGGTTHECDVWAQDCAAGNKCMPWANDGGSSWNATKCVPLDADPKQPGDSCTVTGSGVSGLDDCDVASMCWGVDPETSVGTCVAFCAGSEAAPLCEDPATACMISNSGTLILCLGICNPLVLDCPGSDLCVPNPTGTGFICSLDASGEGGQHGDPCEFLNVCDAGLFCANADVAPNCQSADGCCAEYCDLADGAGNEQCSGQASGEQCTPFYVENQAPPGYEDVGVCILPA